MSCRTRSHVIFCVLFYLKKKTTIVAYLLLLLLIQSTPYTMITILKSLEVQISATMTPNTHSWDTHPIFVINWSKWMLRQAMPLTLSLFFALDHWKLRRIYTFRNTESTNFTRFWNIKLFCVSRLLLKMCPKINWIQKLPREKNNLKSVGWDFLFQSLPMISYTILCVCVCIDNNQFVCCSFFLDLSVAFLNFSAFTEPMCIEF